MQEVKQIENANQPPAAHDPAAGVGAGLSSVAELRAFAAKNKAKVKALKAEIERLRRRSVEVAENAVVVDSYVSAQAVPRRRHRLIVLSFLVFVVAPTIASMAYLFGFAADQYASRVAFSIRSADSAAPTEFLGALTQTLGGSIGPDAEIVHDFIRSQGMVEKAAAVLPLEDIYNAPQNDIVFRLGEGASIEWLTKYWNRMTDVSFDPTTGIVDFEARAFDPESATRIASFVLAESGDLVNQLSMAARQDAVTVARRVLDEAESRLREARREVRMFRNVNQQLDPVEDAKSALGLVGALEAELASTQIELDAQRRLVGDRSPRLPMLRQRISSLEKRIAQERGRLGGGGANTSGATAGETISDTLAEFEELETDLEFAQNAYVSALTAYETAQIETRRQLRYLAPHITPTVSTDAQYPKRLLIAPMIFLTLCVTWSVTLLIIYNVRDRH